MKLTDSQIIDRAYGDGTPIRIPSAKHCAMLWAHLEFAPLAEPECEFDAAMRPQTPGLLGYLRGIPAYFAPVETQTLEAAMLAHPDALTAADYPLQHRFAPGVYIRQVKMPAGHLILGHEHRTKHFNIVLTGRALVAMDGVVQEIVAPATFVSSPGVRKALLILEDCTWQTIHPTTTTDLDALARELIVKSAVFEDYQNEIALLKTAHTQEKKL